MNILKSVNCDKKDIVRASNAVDTFKEIVGEIVTINAAVIFEKEEVDEKTGENKTVVVSAIRKEDGNFNTSISPTIKNSLDTVLSVYSEEEISNGIEVVVRAGTSNSGREFFYIDLY